jgi:hypothetical protein
MDSGWTGFRNVYTGTGAVKLDALSGIPPGEAVDGGGAAR